MTRETLQGPQKRRGHVQTPQQISLGWASREDTGPGRLSLEGLQCRRWCSSRAGCVDSHSEAPTEVFLQTSLNSCPLPEKNTHVHTYVHINVYTQSPTHTHTFACAILHRHSWVCIKSEARKSSCQRGSVLTWGRYGRLWFLLCFLLNYSKLTRPMGNKT